MKMFNNVGNAFFEGFGEICARSREAREKPMSLKEFIEALVRYIDEYISEVFSNEFWSKPYRIYDWEIINELPQLKEHLLKEAWFQDIERNDELYYDDEKKDLDYENIHAKLENEYKLAINLSLELFLSYLKLFPQIRKESVEVDAKESNSIHPNTKIIYQAKLDSFIKTE